jgi:hypothetical protein
VRGLRRLLGKASECPRCAVRTPALDLSREPHAGMGHFVRETGPGMNSMLSSVMRDLPLSHVPRIC